MVDLAFLHSLVLLQVGSRPLELFTVIDHSRRRDFGLFPSYRTSFHRKRERSVLDAVDERNTVAVAHDNRFLQYDSAQAAHAAENAAAGILRFVLNF
jgi:hypothetical protein